MSETKTFLSFFEDTTFKILCYCISAVWFIVGVCSAACKKENNYYDPSIGTALALFSVFFLAVVLYLSKKTGSGYGIKIPKVKASFQLPTKNNQQANKFGGVGVDNEIQ